MLLGRGAKGRQGHLCSVVSVFFSIKLTNEIMDLRKSDVFLNHEQQKSPTGQSR